jgi:hypothetical protein
MNRREFVRAAAGTAMFTRITGAFPSAASYDLIVRGGRVIDPSLRIDAGSSAPGAGHSPGDRPSSLTHARRRFRRAARYGFATFVSENAS